MIKLMQSNSACLTQVIQGGPQPASEYQADVIGNLVLANLVFVVPMPCQRSGLMVNHLEATAMAKRVYEQGLIE